jgi:hypothetical protein
VFVDEERSYAERTNQANGDLGWIRVLSFRESRPWIDVRRFRDDLGGNRNGREENLAPEVGAPAPLARDGAKSARPDAQSFDGGRPSGPAADANPGTGWGERRHDPVNSVEFQAARTPSDQLVLRYEYASGLRALGIDLRGSRLWDRENGQLGFSRPPRW